MNQNTRDILCFLLGIYAVAVFVSIYGYLALFASLPCKLFLLSGSTAGILADKLSGTGGE